MGRNQYWAGRVYDLCVYYMTGTPEGSTESVFFLWRSRESNLRPLVTRHSTYPLHHGGFSTFPMVDSFCGFSMGRNQYRAGRVYDLCVYYMTGTPEGSTESGFMEKLGFEPATPGLQGIALIHYTTRAFPMVDLKLFCRNAFNSVPTHLSICRQFQNNKSYNMHINFYVHV